MRGPAPKVRRRIIRDDGPDPIDIFVGQRMRERRRQAGISQTEVGRKLGLSFQAVQKYETAASRISASALYRLSELLDVPPGYFFEGYSESDSDLTRLKRKPKR
jgi:transcriptional regulator with XRE-family HTH domain